MIRTAQAEGEGQVREHENAEHFKSISKGGTARHLDVPHFFQRAARERHRPRLGAELIFHGPQ